MNVLGFLVTLQNIQSFAGPGGGQLQDLSVRVSELHRLEEELRSLPDFTIEDYKKTGYCRFGNVGKYLAKNLLSFIECREMCEEEICDCGNPKDESVILTLTFSDLAGYSADSYGQEGALTYFIPRARLSDEDRYRIYNYAMTRAKRAATEIEE